MKQKQTMTLPASSNTKDRILAKKLIDTKQKHNFHKGKLLLGTLIMRNGCFLIYCKRKLDKNVSVRLLGCLNDTTGFYLQQHFSKKFTRYKMGPKNAFFQIKFEITY